MDQISNLHQLGFKSLRLDDENQTPYKSKSKEDLPVALSALLSLLKNELSLNLISKWLIWAAVE
ncbi:hypothetical protein [Noviherbaspirillum humi]|uniref:hypothetical protein n=1 Tax=Noviherbaspirillum humi TaxID=1688639 RepID=UPI001160707C|nr:hypothetical protein [Noviherbaspirillum humi]